MQTSKPLTGIRVLELGAYISGPYAGALLASLGADVVKVEAPGGDAFRRGVGVESHYFVQYNAGKRSIAVNLKDPRGVALIKSMLPQFDVFIENSRPGKTAQLGLGPEVCLEINPRLIYSSASGFGDGGTWRDRAAYDSIGQSMGGFYSVMSEAGMPQLSGTCVGDLITAITATMGILAGLVGRGLDPEGQGTLTQTSLFEAMSALTIDAMTQYTETGATPTRQSRHPQAQNFCLMTASGDAITLHLSSSQKFWRSLTRAMGRPDLADDPRFTGYYERMTNYFALRPIVEAEFLKKSRAEWETVLIAEDVPFAPVLTMQELATHPQTEWLQLLEPKRGECQLVRPPLRFQGERPDRTFDAPEVGQHSRELAAEFCSPEDLKTLIADGVIVQHEKLESVK
ncbi:CaiB/BaiF CoA transferase family protein [Antarctobacter sp.]|uniref:CaiB/BaiF CoA transferase family protein n=1 Tax=Antarctobacter sp. TaxID=1872577 RepID=UPI003A95950D